MPKKNLLFFLNVFLLNCLSSLFAYSQQLPAWQSKLSPSLVPKLSAAAPFEFIVIMNKKGDVNAVKNIHGKEAKGIYVFETLRAFAENSQKEIIQQLKYEEAEYQPFWVVNAIRIKGTPALLQNLALREDVERILNNTPLRSSDPIAAQPDLNRDVIIPWGIDSLHAPAVWALGYEGQGVVIGGNDTGFDWEHPAIINQYRGWDGTAVDHNYNWHDAIHAIDWHNYGENPCGIDIAEPCDDYGHGTHTMGTMVGETGDLKIGVAPQAKWIGERNMERGWGNLAGYLEAFQWFIAPTDLSNENADPSKAPHVINNSWYCSLEEGCDETNFSMMEEVVNNVKASGIVVVVSAGNSGPGCNTIAFPPALFENSFTIGAVDYTMNAASFSSRGNTSVNGSNLLKPNVAAPGVDVFSCIPGGQYAFYSGTSMAGPHAAGAVALVISANPSLAGEVDLIENILEETAQPVTTTDGCGNDISTSLPNNTYGYGIIDVYAAVQKALLATSSSIQNDNAFIYVTPSLTNNEIAVYLNSAANEGLLQLYSTVGQKIRSIELPSGRSVINLSGLPAGVYLYSVMIDGKYASGKLVKQ